MGYGVSACATCDGAFFKDKDVVVVGGGDTAMEEATFLTRFASKVDVVHRRGDLRASKIMQERARKNPKIKFVWNSAIDVIHGTQKDGVTGVTLKDTNSGATKNHKTDGVFIAIGHQPNSQLFKGQLDMDDVGYLKTQPGSTYTNIRGVCRRNIQTQSIDRQSPRLAPDAWPPSMPSAGWRLTIPTSRHLPI